ncbi:MAG: LysE family translocator [Verrucomicrobia bacterium]|nr:LysE family translocator [Verrucomicrobiota bacterium]
MELLLLYCGWWLLLAVTPGPAVLCVVGHALRAGLRGAVSAILGITLGHVFFFVCIALGLSAILESAAHVYDALRWAGAGYLACLGLRMIARSFRSNETTDSKTPPKVSTSSILEAWAIQATNPKALLFMSALLPQFIDKDRPLPPQLLALFMATVIIDAMVLLNYAWIAIRSGRMFRRPKVHAWFDRLLGACMLAFAARLAWWRRAD